MSRVVKRAWTRFDSHEVWNVDIGRLRIRDGKMDYDSCGAAAPSPALKAHERASAFVPSSKSG